MKSGKCPKCNSSEVAEIPSELGTYNQIKLGALSIAHVTRYVCTSCGYLEQYVAEEESLKKLRERL